MTAEQHQPHSRYVIVTGVCAVVFAVSIAVMAWSRASDTDLAQHVRPLKINEQRLGHRQARLSDPVSQARLRRLAGKPEDIRLNLLETIERLKGASDLHSLEIEFLNKPNDQAGEPGEIAFESLSMNVDTTVLHEGALVDLLAALRSAAGSWPARIDTCTVSRSASDRGSLPTPVVRARCTLRVEYWPTPLAAESADLMTIVPEAWSRKLIGKSLFNEASIRAEWNRTAAVSEHGLIARMNGDVSGSPPGLMGSDAIALATQADTSHSSNSTNGPRQGHNEERMDGMVNPRAHAPMQIRFGGVIHGRSSTMVWVNGVPCEVAADGQVSVHCGQDRTVTALKNPVQRVLFRPGDLRLEEAVRLQVVYADGTQTQLGIGERSR